MPESDLHVYETEVVRIRTQHRMKVQASTFLHASPFVDLLGASSLGSATSVMVTFHN